MECCTKLSSQFVIPVQVLRNSRIMYNPMPRIAMGMGYGGVAYHGVVGSAVVVVEWVVLLFILCLENKH